MGGVQAYLSDYVLDWIRDLKVLYEEPMTNLSYHEFLHRVLAELPNM